MDQIVLKRSETRRKPKRASVVIKPETYVRVYDLAHDIGMTVETLVDTLLKAALDSVVVTD